MARWVKANSRAVDDVIENTCTRFQPGEMSQKQFIAGGAPKTTGFFYGYLYSSSIKFNFGIF